MRHLLVRKVQVLSFRNVSQGEQQQEQEQQEQQLLNNNFST